MTGWTAFAVFGATMAALIAPAHAARTTRSIPRAFWGDWSASPERCAPGPVDSGNMRIGAQRIDSFESRGRVLRVRIARATDIEVQSRVTHNGGTFGSSERLRLIERRTKLIVGDDVATDEFQRCRS